MNAEKIFYISLSFFILFGIGVTSIHLVQNQSLTFGIHTDFSGLIYALQQAGSMLKTLGHWLLVVGFVVVFVGLLAVVAYGISWLIDQHRQDQAEKQRQVMAFAQSDYEKNKARYFDQVEMQRAALSVERLAADVDKARFQANVLRCGHNESLIIRDLSSEFPQYFCFEGSSRPAPRLASGSQISETPRPELTAPNNSNILPVLVQTPRIWICGGQGSGKTSLMSHLAECYLNQCELIILDSHDQPGKWPAGAQIFGGGRDYDGIARAMDLILDIMQRRYAEYFDGKPEHAFKRIRVMADEWTHIPRRLPAGVQRFQEIFTEGRKVGIDYCFASHSDRISKTGFAGCKDIFEEIDAIVYLKNQNGRRYALMNDQVYSLPGPYIGGREPVTLEPRRTSYNTPNHCEPCSKHGLKNDVFNGGYRLLETGYRGQEREILERAIAGESRNSIARNIFGGKGKNYTRIKTLLDSCGL
jgi:Na+-transporting methylmalonyl-CoA/oxaloacetate decarboxylase gamma subunit